jgi:uncharacterized protein (TIGR01244 family)
MRSGYRSLVNLRCEEQESQPRTPHAEREIAREAGLRYVHFPVSGASFDAARVDEFRREIQALPEAVHLHCASGKRASAFAMMHIAVEPGQPGEDVLRRAEEMGFAWDVPEMTKFVCAYLDSPRA